MLMPIGDDNTGRNITPYVTYILMALNLFVFAFLQPNTQFTYGYAVIPAEITNGGDLVQGVRTPQGIIPQAPGPQPIFLTILTAMFMHGGWAHLLGNMLYLWIFGDNVEDAMGHGKFLVFYLLCGALATLAHIVSGPNSLIPSLGASGAIAGVLGGYLLLFPTRSVRVLFGFFGIFLLPASLVIGGWIVMQLFSGVSGTYYTQQTGAGGVAYWAHVGGALAGLILVNLFRNPVVQARVEQRMGYPTGRTYQNHPPRGGGGY
jgi:membrane associated rhomboid family serine protease